LSLIDLFSEMSQLSSRLIQLGYPTTKPEELQRQIEWLFRCQGASNFLLWLSQKLSADYSLHHEEILRWTQLPQKNKLEIIEAEKAIQQAEEEMTSIRDFLTSSEKIETEVKNLAAELQELEDSLQVLEARKTKLRARRTACQEQGLSLRNLMETQAVRSSKLSTLVEARNEEFITALNQAKSLSERLIHHYEVAEPNGRRDEERLRCVSSLESYLGVEEGLSSQLEELIAAATDDVHSRPKHPSQLYHSLAAEISRLQSAVVLSEDRHLVALLALARVQAQEKGLLHALPASTPALSSLRQLRAVEELEAQLRGHLAHYLGEVAALFAPSMPHSQAKAGEEARPYPLPYLLSAGVLAAHAQATAASLTKRAGALAAVKKSVLHQHARQRIIGHAVWHSHHHRKPLLALLSALTSDLAQIAPACLPRCAPPLHTSPDWAVSRPGSRLDTPVDEVAVPSLLPLDEEVAALAQMLYPRTGPSTAAFTSRDTSQIFEQAEAALHALHERLQPVLHNYQLKTQVLETSPQAIAAERRLFEQFFLEHRVVL
jgi:hypothetical protein